MIGWSEVMLLAPSLEGRFRQAGGVTIGEAEALAWATGLDGAAADRYALALVRGERASSETPEVDDG